MKIGALIGFLVMGFVAISLAFALIPEITALTHSETGIVGTVLDMVIWLIPAAAGVGIIMAGVRFITSKRNG